jgi:biopolymer transport protein TolR
MGIALPSTNSKPQQSRPEINITPLVDVVLVLLIIFMVIAPALEHGERVELPGVRNADPQEKQKMDVVTVTAAASGSLYWEKESVDDAELRTRATALFRSDPTRRVVIKGDGSMPYAKARRVFAVFQEAGISNCSLVVEKKKEGT